MQGESGWIPPPVDAVPLYDGPPREPASTGGGPSVEAAGRLASLGHGDQVTSPRAALRSRVVRAEAEAPLDPL
eukprot:895753-Pyramimonas_sp.AAC.1